MPRSARLGAQVGMDKPVALPRLTVNLRSVSGVKVQISSSCPAGIGIKIGEMTGINIGAIIV